MSTLEIAAAAAPRATVPGAVRVAQFLLLVPLGVVVGYAAIYFSLTENVSVVDWLVAVWALALGLGNVYVGLKLASGHPEFRRAALALVGTHIVFGLAKVVGYGELEAGTFIAIDALAIWVLSTGSVRRFMSASDNGKHGRSRGRCSRSPKSYQSVPTDSRRAPS